MTVKDLIIALLAMPMGALVDIQLVNGGQRQIADVVDPEEGCDVVYICEADC